MSVEDNINIVKSAYECFGRGDLQGILDLCSDDISWVTPNVDGSDFYGPKAGKSGVIEFFAGLGTQETSPEFEPRDFFAAGDKVVVLGRWAATVAATGKHWETEFSHTFTIRDGKVVSFREIFDNLAASKAFQKSAAQH